MSPFIDFLVTACNPASGWIENQIKHGRKVGLVGKDSQLLMDMFKNPGKVTSKWTINICLRSWMRRRLTRGMSRSYSLCGQKVCRICRISSAICGRGLGMSLQFYPTSKFGSIDIIQMAVYYTATVWRGELYIQLRAQTTHLRPWIGTTLQQRFMLP